MVDQILARNPDASAGSLISLTTDWHIQLEAHCFRHRPDLTTVISREHVRKHESSRNIGHLYPLHLWFHRVKHKFHEVCLNLEVVVILRYPLLCCFKLHHFVRVCSKLNKWFTFEVKGMLWRWLPLLSFEDQSSANLVFNKVKIISELRSASENQV